MSTVFLSLDIPPEKQAEIDRLFSKFERKLAKALVGCVVFNTKGETLTPLAPAAAVDIEGMVYKAIRNKEARGAQ